jgi:hypothetical protein
VNIKIGAIRDERLNFTGTGGVYREEELCVDEGVDGGVARPLDVPLVDVLFDRLRRFFSSATPEG